MKKKDSTVFLVNNFREDYSRNQSYKIHGRRLQSMMDEFAEQECKEVEDAMFSEISKVKGEKNQLQITLDEKNSKLTECGIRSAKIIVSYYRVRMLAILSAALFIVTLAAFLYVIWPNLGL